jgi:prepilin-type N-terminal cleavage/methylation domain-containing protein
MRGFTLIELVIVVLIVAVLAVAAMPSFSVAASDMRADSAARAMLGHLRYAQSVAVSQNKIIAMQFETGGYYIAEVTSMATALDGSKVGGTVLTDPISRLPMRFMNNGSGPFRGVTVVTANFGGQAWFAFDATGAPSSGGSVEIDYGGRRRTITVAVGTGRVTATGDAE